MSMQLMPVEVFCSYAHKDEAWLRKLEKHMAPLKQQGLISFWYDRLIIPGTNWAHVIDSHLESASVILLLVSTDFLASDYCVGIEMKRALERQDGSEALVIPILISEVGWKESPLVHLQALPTDAQPLTRWSDEETALVDVAAGIRRAIEALPLLAASAPRAALPPVWNIPYPRNPFFLGRETELAQVRQYLQGGHAAALSQPQAISGLGGVGKSQMALEYAYRYHQDYQAVLWVRAESAETLVSSYMALATDLRLPQRDEKEQEVVIQAVKRWLQTHRNWLLILDNADELALVLDFLPPTPGGHLLLTTRATATEGVARRLEIETFLPEQGALLLLRRSGFLEPSAKLSQASIQERDIALQMSRELGGLPLALDQAGAYLEATGTNLADYWHLYRQHRADLLKERRGLVAYHPEPVATTWSLSFRRIEEKNPAAADLLRLCAYLAPDSIPEEILTEGASLLGPVLSPMVAEAYQRNQAIEALRAYSLLRRDPRAQTLSTHRLIQAVLQDQQEQAERQTWAERAMRAVNAAFPPVEYGTWAQCERLLPHARSGAYYIEQYQIKSEEAGRLLHETASYLQDRGRFAEAEPLYQRALRIREQILKPDHSDVAQSLNGLAQLYREQGKYEAAEPLYQRALRIREQTLGPDHPDVAQSLNGLAQLYREQGKYEAAESFFQHALHIREQVLGPDHPDVAQSLNGLALLYYRRGRKEAEPLFQRALDIWEQRLGPEHPDVALVLDSLGNLYFQQGQYEKATLLFQRALDIWEKQLGPEHPRVAIVLNNLAGPYFEQGDYKAAEPLYQRALRIREQQLGPMHPDVAYPLNNLALIYKEQGHYEKAEQFFLRARDIWEQQLGSEHLQVAIALCNLADLYYEQGKYKMVEPLYQRALTTFERVFEPEHFMVAYPLYGLALLSFKQSKYEAAERLFLHSLSIRERELGSQHPETAQTLHDLALLQEAQGNNEEARSLYVRALEAREQTLGVQHPKTVQTRERIKALLHVQEQRDQATQCENAQDKQERSEAE